MEKNELRYIVVKYWLVTISLDLIYLLIGAYGLFLRPYALYSILGFLLLVEFILFFIMLRRLKEMYDGVANLEEAIQHVLYQSQDKKRNDEILVLKDESLERLYDSYYKLVEQLETAVEKEKREKEFLRDIISDISHQLKTPLSSISVFNELMLAGAVTDEKKQRQMLEQSNQQIMRMEWMVLALLKLARIEAGAIQFNKSMWDATYIIQQSKAGVEHMLQERKQYMEIVCEGNEQIYCDGDWLCEALINLMKNASDYSEAGSKITVSVEAQAFFTVVEIRDQGMGILEDKLGHIFQRFYRVNQEVNPNSVGIGLSLAKSIIEGQGGYITVNSVLGEYTSFRITMMKNS